MAASSQELSPEELNELLTSLMPEIQGYRVMRRIGCGGMSYVYLGVQESLDRQVAIKVMRPEAITDEISKQRFDKEARTIAKLEHPCIVGIHEVGRTEQGLLYYVLPYLARGHLGQRDLRNDEARVFEVVRSLLAALEYAHTRGVVHRDVKAENVLFDNADRPLLTDFGIAISRRDNARMTGGGNAVGSSGYMAPEQARGERVDGRADLYSVGVLAFEMLTGQLPFRDADPIGLALKHAQDPVPLLPPDRRHWQAFIEKAMAKSPVQRFGSAVEMRESLAGVEAASARQASRRQRRRPAAAWLEQVRQHGLRERWCALSARHLPLPGFDALKRWGGRLRRPPARVVKASVALAGLLLVALVAWWLWPEGSSRIPPAESIVALAGQAVPAAAPGPMPPDAVPPALPHDPSARADVVESASASPGTAEVAAVDPPPASGEEAPVAEPASGPLPPGLAEIAAARAQIARGRLTQPPGANALDSLLQAKRLLPGSRELAPLAERWLEAVLPHLRRNLSEGHEAVAQTLHARATQLREAFALGGGEAWHGVESTLAEHLRPRLRAALAAKDADLRAQLKAQARDWGLAPALLEPEWSTPIVLLRPGDVLPGPTRMVLVRLPGERGPGLAAMAHEVSRSEFARFASGTSRTPSRCRNRSAAISLKKRSWSEPGFAQGDGHPVVCVSATDASAYADWLGTREQQPYRLPSVAEWHVLAGFDAGGDRCGSARLDCGSPGTVAGSFGAASPVGLRGLHGNVREWLAECGPGCRTRLAAGAGWRDAPERADVLGSEGLDPTLGFDDVGFRLVRDVSADEVEIR